MTDLIIIGAGGFALEVIDLIHGINENSPQFKIIGLLDDNKVGNLVRDYEILGKPSDYIHYKNCSFVIAIANPKSRSKFYELLHEETFKTPNLIHPNTDISRYAIIEDDSGIVINAFSTISAIAKLNQGVIIDSGVYIGHECELGSFVTVYPSSSISGNTKIGQHTEIGLGSRIIQGLFIGSNTIIGAGSTVINDIPSHVVAVGSPCKTIKER